MNTQFGYNGDGVRLRLVAAGTLTTYTQDYAAPLPVVLQAKTGTTTTQYVYSLGTRPVAEYEAAAWEYLLPNALGSVRQMANASGNVTLLKSYEPYGSVLNSQGSAASIFGYAGEQADSTGLIYLRARYMQPGLGMFLSRDRWMGDELRPGSMNGWNYVEANPVNRTDPFGLCTPIPQTVSPSSGPDLICTVEAGDIGIYQIGRDFGVPENRLWELVQYQRQFQEETWREPYWIPIGKPVHIPHSWRTQQSPNPTPQPGDGSGPSFDGHLVDAYIIGNVHWQAECINITAGDVAIKYCGECVMPDHVLAIGQGHETVATINGWVAQYNYEFAVFKLDPGLPNFSLGSLTTALYGGVASGFLNDIHADTSVRPEFENYAGNAVCEVLTGGINKPGVGFGKQRARCGPLAYPFNILTESPSINFGAGEDAIWSAIVGVSVGVTAFSIGLPVKVLGVYRPPTFVDRRPAEAQGIILNVRNYSNP